MAKTAKTNNDFTRSAGAAKSRHGTEPLGKSQDLQHQKYEILEKTLRIFTERGYDGTSVSMVAEGLGMSKANIYYHFSSKENLLYQIHLYFLSKYIIPIVKEAEQLVDPQDRIIHFLRKFTYVWLENEGGRLLIHEVGRLNETHKKEIRKVWQKAYMLMRESIGDLQRSGAHRGALRATRRARALEVNQCS